MASQERAPFHIASSAFAMVAITAATAAAQQPPAEVRDAAPQSQEALTTMLRPGERIEVVSQDGTTVTGSLAEVSPARLVLRVRTGAVEVPTMTIREVSRVGDPIWDGAVGGLVLGGIIGFFTGLLGGAEDDALGWAGYFGLIGIGIGGGLGTVIDAASEGKVTVYRAQARRLNVAPTLAQRQRGIVVTWRF